MSQPKLTEPMAYVTRCHDCGGVNSACADYPTNKKDTAKFCSSAVRDDYALERVTCDFVRQTKWCGCHRKAKK